MMYECFAIDKQGFFKYEIKNIVYWVNRGAVQGIPEIMDPESASDASVSR